MGMHKIRDENPILIWLIISKVATLRVGIGWEPTQAQHTNSKLNPTQPKLKLLNLGWIPAKLELIGLGLNEEPFV